MLLWLSPIFFLFILGLIGSEALKKERFVDPFQLAIVNEDPAFETKLVIRQLTEGEHLTSVIRTIEADEKGAKRLLEENKIAAVIFIPNGFSKDVARGVNTPVTVIGNEKRPLQAELTRQVMESAADFTSAAQSGINTVSYFMKGMDFSQKERKKEFKKDVVSFSFHILGRGSIFEEKKQAAPYQVHLWQYYAVSFLALMMMIWSFTALFLLNNKINKALSLRLLSAGFSPYHAACSKVIFVLLTVLVSSIVLASMLIVSGIVSLHIEAGHFAVGLTVTVFLFTSFFVMADALLANEKIYLFAGVTFLLLGAATGGHIVPAVYFPDWLERLSSFTINSWVLEYMLLLFYPGQDQPFFHLSLLLLCAACSFILITAAVLHRRVHERRKTSGHLL
ncbi:ABC transporter permease [Bacillus aerolatus]|nr:ABC transporter permease [Bacillus aerolatus]